MPSLTTRQSLLKIVKTSWFNVLLIFIPLGFLAYFLKWGKVAIILLNSFAIIPLAKLLESVTEDISRHAGQTVGSLLDATFGSLVEFIVACITLKAGEIRVVQAYVVGSLISNLLLVLGSSILAGGLKYQIQEFNKDATQTDVSLIMSACSLLLIPVAFSIALPPTKDFQIVNLSHYAVIIMLIVYVLYLLFQLKTHTELYATEKNQEPEFTFIVSFVVLLVVAAILGACFEFLVSSLEDIMTSVGLTKAFAGLILLPAVSKTSEFVTAITAAMKNEIQSVISTVAARSVQTTLFITPFLVLVGWIIYQPMTLFFEVFDIVVLFFSVFILNSLIQNGRSNWLTGLLLLVTYVIIVIAYYYYPDPPEP